MSRYRSRSGTADISSIGTPRTPAFQPPSFYAAAAGLSYPRDGLTTLSPESTCTSPGIHTANVELMLNPTMEEIEDRPSTKSRRSNSLTRSLSRALPKSNKAQKHKHERVKSQLVDIPFLEAQLLPSLRDTVDRMTQLPKLRAQDDTNQCEPQRQQDYDEYTGGSRKRYQVSSSSVQTTALPSAPSVVYSASPATTSVTSNAPRNPKPQGQGPSAQDNFTVSDSKTSKVPRSTIKSSLRAPTVYATPESPQPTPPSTTKSLRSVKSLMTPRLGAQSTSTTPSINSTVLAEFQSSKIPQISSKYNSASNFSIPKLKSNPTTSAHIQESTFSPHSSVSQGHQPVPLSGSDLDVDYGWSADGSRLVVTNAEIIPSSSESEAAEREAEDKIRIRASADARRQPNSNPTNFRDDTTRSPGRRSKSTRRETAVGLGVKFTPDDHIQKSLRNRQANNLSYQDVKKEMEAIDRYREDRGTNHSGDEASVYEDSDMDYQSFICNERDTRQDSKHGNYSVETLSGRRRRDALIGLVNNLQQDIGAHLSPARQSVSSQRDSDGQYYAQGVAISASYEMDDSPVYQDKGLGWNESSPIWVGRQKGRDEVVERDRFLPQIRSGAFPNSDQAPRLVDATSPRKPKRQPDRRSISVPPQTRSQHVSQFPIPIVNDTNVVDSQPILRSSHKRAKSTHRNLPIPKSEEQSNSSPTETNVVENPSDHLSVHNTGSPNTRLEREAFGIPASLSYVGTRYQPVVSDGEHKLSRMTSDGEPYAMRQVEERWGGRESGGLSIGAQALFRNISSVGRDRSDSNSDLPLRRRSQSLSASAHPASRRGRPQSRCSMPDNSPQNKILPSVPSSSSNPSAYEDEDFVQNTSQQEETVLANSWRAALPSSMYDSLLQRYGSGETQRQEVIYQILRSERNYVGCLRGVVHSFFVPLRRKQSKVWLTGVPSQVSKFCDWLEDILNLHIRILESMEAHCSVWQSGSVVLKIAQTLRNFVSRLEVYQPYLVRVDEVRKVIADAKSEEGNEFGEFLRLREASLHSNKETFSEMLLRPVEQLSELSHAFKELLEVTSKDHPDYLNTFSLHHAYRMMIHVMEEVKKREREYESVKNIVAQIDGLSISILARRERRLLWQGSVEITLCSSDPRGKAVDTSRRAAEENAGQQKRKGADAVLQWNERRGRSHSTQSSESSVYSATSPPTSPSSSSSVLDASREKSRIPRIVLPDDHDDSQEPKGGPVSRSESRLALMLVFVDVIIFARSDCLQPKHSPGQLDFKWDLLSDVGVARIIGVRQKDESTVTRRRLGLELLSLSLQDLHTGVIPDNSPVTVSEITFPSGDGVSFESAVVAIQRCQAHTLRSFSFPSHNGRYLPHGSQVDFELDTQRSVMDILNTGLPLPRSPSTFLNDKWSMDLSMDILNTDQERAERGWWTLRFQQVLREMQRQDPMQTF